MTNNVSPKRDKHSELKAILGFLVCLILLLLFNFYPALDNEFVYWDDQYYVVENTFINQPTLTHFKDLGHQIISLNYHPITMWSLWLNAYCSGVESAYPFIATNVFFHILNSLLVFFFIKKLSKGKLWVAFIVAIIFGIHPMHVESVVWVSERKDVLYTFFFLIACISYLRYVDSQQKRNYFLSFCSFLLACGAKAMAVSLVPVLFVLDIYKKRTWSFQNLFIEKSPFFLVGLLVGSIAIQVQAGGVFFDVFEKTTDASAISQITDGFWNKLSISSYGLFYYFKQFLLPFNLSALHPYAPVLEKGYLVYYPIFSILFFSLMIYSYLKFPKIAFGFAFFLLTILLVLQFIPVGVAIVAERYTYLPYLGLSYIVGIGLDKLARNHSKNAMLLMLTFIVASFTYLTRTQVEVWQNHRTLFTNVVEKYPKNPYGREYLAAGLYKEGKVEDAIYHLDYAIHNLSYENSVSFEQLGIYWKGLGNQEKALALFDKAIALDADNFTARFNRGINLIDSDPNAALEDLNFCKQSKNNALKELLYAPMARCYGLLGAYEKAIQEFNKAMEVVPEKELIYYNRALTYELMGEKEKAIEDYKKALELDASFEDARQRLEILRT